MCAPIEGPLPITNHTPTQHTQHPAQEGPGGGTPTSRLKRKAAELDSDRDEEGEGLQGGQGEAARGAPRRRLALTPLFEGAAGEEAGTPGTGGVRTRRVTRQQTAQMSGAASAFAAPEVQGGGGGQGEDVVMGEAAVAPSAAPVPTSSVGSQQGAGMGPATSEGRPGSAGKPRNPLLARFFSNESLQVGWGGPGAVMVYGLLVLVFSVLAPTLACLGLLISVPAQALMGPVAVALVWRCAICDHVQHACSVWHFGCPGSGEGDISHSKPGGGGRGQRSQTPCADHFAPGHGPCAWCVRFAWPCGEATS